MPARSSADVAKFVDRVQGNILEGFNKDYQNFLFLEFVDQAKARAWMGEIAREVASVEEVRTFNDLFKRLRKRRRGELGILKTTWMNIAFSFQGLTRLGVSASDLALFPLPFSAGMKARAGVLGDQGASDPANWILPVPVGGIDAVMIVASDLKADAGEQSLRYIHNLGINGGVRLVHLQEGAVRLDDPGHEHFGFKDGVSQPGVRHYDDHLPGGEPIQGAPGQDRLHPGEFLLGYPAQLPSPKACPEGGGKTNFMSPNPDEGTVSPANAGESAPDWAVDGSYLVFRRLAQDVPGFHDFVAQMSKTVLPDLTAKDPLTAVEVMGAKLVGRYKSGCPLELTKDEAPLIGKSLPKDFNPAEGDPSRRFPTILGNRVKPGDPGGNLADDDLFDNHFEYGDDPLGGVVPRGAHIRKVYPRDSATPGGGEADTQTHRLLRRGIPFGTSFRPSLGATGHGRCGRGRGERPATAASSSFCYQSRPGPAVRVRPGRTGSTTRLFPGNWSFPLPSPDLATGLWTSDLDGSDPDGQDPIIAQDSPAGPMKVPEANGTVIPKDRFAMSHFVMTTGGEYFFQPSIEAIFAVLADGQANPFQPGGIPGAARKPGGSDGPGDDPGAGSSPPRRGDRAAGRHRPAPCYLCLIDSNRPTGRCGGMSPEHRLRAKENRMRNLKLFVGGLALMVVVVASTSSTEAGVLLQGYYFRGTPNNERGVPSPADPADHVTDFWWDHLASQAGSLREAGITAIWLPAPTKGASGTSSSGFDEFDDYDLGSKNQKGAIPTRYGTREQLARCVAVFRANGIDVYLDLVENQRSGGSGPGGFTFRYADADGKTPGGRFSKDKGDFHNNEIPQDPDVFGPDFSFGSDLAPINGKPPGHVSNGLKASADWMTRALDTQGYRIDDAKGISTRFARELLDFGSLKGKFAVGEFFDGNVGLVESWISGPIGLNGRASAFDFPLRLNLISAMCNNAGFFDMSQLDHAGLAGVDPLHAVTFVENHDTDITSPIVRNKMQAYALILTSEGYPCVFYKDYSTDPGCFGLKKPIDNLIFIHEKIADGTTQQRWKDHDVFAYERLGGNHLLVGLNNNGIAEHTITVATGFGANTPLHDYTGHSPDVRTDGSGSVTINVPKNTNGLGYVCYSRAGIGGGTPPAGFNVTQDYEGAQDLDIKPADNTAFVPVGRVFVEAGRPIKGTLNFDQAGWTNMTKITLELDGPDGAKLASRDFDKTTPQGETITATAASTGFHAFRIRSSDTPSSNLRPSYKLSVTYRAPRAIPAGP